MDDLLYSPSVQLRLAATKALPSPEPKLCPTGLRGAANAVFILLGPSFGKAHKGVPPYKGGSPRPEGNNIWLGKGLGLSPFDYDGGRFKRWNDFFMQCCESRDIPDFLTALFNLDWCHSAKESCVPEQNLITGSDQVLPFVEAAKPRVVVALTNRVYKVFLDCLNRNGYTFREIPSRLTRPALEVSKPSCDCKWLFVKTQNHPSRSFFSQKDRQVFGEFVKPFLKDI